MNAWLITWESPTGKPWGSRSRIAAILPSTTPAKTIDLVMELLYANHCADKGEGEIYFSEQLRFASRRPPAKVVHHPFDQRECGHNPFLRARAVKKIEAVEADGSEMLRWDEPSYPRLPPGELSPEDLPPPSAITYRRREYNPASHKITHVPPTPERSR